MFKIFSNKGKTQFLTDKEKENKRLQDEFREKQDRKAFQLNFTKDVCRALGISIRTLKDMNSLGMSFYIKEMNLYLNFVKGAYPFYHNESGFFVSSSEYGSDSLLSRSRIKEFRDDIIANIKNGKFEFKYQGCCKFGTTLYNYIRKKELFEKLNHPKLGLIKDNKEEDKKYFDEVLILEVKKDISNKIKEAFDTQNQKYTPYATYKIGEQIVCYHHCRYEIEGLDYFNFKNTEDFFKVKRLVQNLIKDIKDGKYKMLKLLD